MSESIARNVAWIPARVLAQAIDMADGWGGCSWGCLGQVLAVVGRRGVVTLSHHEPPSRLEHVLTWPEGITRRALLRYRLCIIEGSGSLRHRLAMINADTRQAYSTWVSVLRPYGMIELIDQIGSARARTPRHHATADAVVVRLRAVS